MKIPPYRLLRQLPLLLTLVAILVAGCAPGMPNLQLRHYRQYPDGSEHLQQVLRYGSDSVFTLADVRARLIVNNSKKGTRLRTRDGAMLAYTLTIPAAAFDSSSIVVFLRGHDNTRYSWTEAQLRLASAGIPSVILDLRSTGESTGTATFGLEEREDVHELLQHIRSAHRLPAQNVALVGRTFGANVALQAAAIDRSGTIRTLVLEGLFARFNDMAGRLLPHQTQYALARELSSRGIPVDSLNPAHWLKRIADLPILFVWGQLDNYVSERERGVTALCYAPKTPEHRQVLMVEKLHHGLDRDPAICSEEEYQSYLAERDAFLKRYMQ